MAVAMSFELNLFNGQWFEHTSMAKNCLLQCCTIWIYDKPRWVDRTGLTITPSRQATLNHYNICWTKPTAKSWFIVLLYTHYSICMCYLPVLLPFSFLKDTSSCLSQGVVGVADLVAVGKFHHLWAHTGLHRCIQGGCIVGDATCMMWKLPIGWCNNTKGPPSRLVQVGQVHLPYDDIYPKWDLPVSNTLRVELK